jgi:hypothetical protein
MTTYEYNQLLKFLYFEGYADSYEEAEYIIEDLNDDEFESLCEEVFDLDEETEEEKKRNERRARIAELQAQGRVMTSAKRTSQKAKQRKEEKKSENLEKLANAALDATRGASRRSSRPMGSEEPKEKPKAPKANRRLSSTVKDDRLSSKADEILRMMRSEESDLYNIILSHLLDEGYADNIESAEVILENMSEGWVESVVEGYKKLPVEKMESQSKRIKKDKPYKARKEYGKRSQKIKDTILTHSPETAKTMSFLNKRWGASQRKVNPFQYKLEP